MKFDLYHWREVNPNEQVQFSTGKVQVMCSCEAPLYLEADGVEVLAGVGTSHNLTTAQVCKGRVEAPKGSRVFVYQGHAASVRPIGEKFTSADLMPLEGEHTLAIKRALREFQMERLADRRERAAESRARKREREAARAEAPAEMNPMPEEPPVEPSVEVSSDE
jgi:hypothetical protein